AYDPAKAYVETPKSYERKAEQNGRVVREAYEGINGPNALFVYLPYGYDENKEYNVFYLMHGGGENENTAFTTYGGQVVNMLDNMIQNGDVEPTIVVAPTFTKSTADTFYKEFRANVIPLVEGKYSTYAKSVSEEDIRASRMHRAFGGFSMGSVTTWTVFQHCLDIVGYFMPLSGEHWCGTRTPQEKADAMAKAVDESGLAKNQYFIFAATGDKDIAYPNFNPMVEEMKKREQFVYTSDFSKGNFYFLVAKGGVHNWFYVRQYVYNGLPFFFHENN
ncbi:MAG: 1,4-beta-xylanase, partial [Thermoguttaceae bacterium]|nr:1,4-beta-xylanase [Thermoguttaceae bacterium]